MIGWGFDFSLLYFNFLLIVCFIREIQKIRSVRCLCGLHGMFKTQVKCIPLHKTILTFYLPPPFYFYLYASLFLKSPSSLLIQRQSTFRIWALLRLDRTILLVWASGHLFCLVLAVAYFTGLNFGPSFLSLLWPCTILPYHTQLLFLI